MTLKAIILTGFLTGLRKSELLNLRWRNIDLKRCSIIVESKDTKNKKPKITYFDPMLTEVLEAIKIKGGEYVFPSPIKKGKPLSDIRTAWHNALRRAGLDKQSEGQEKIVFHTLRHTFASHHMMQGTDPDTLKELGGWKSNEYQRYAHLSPEHKEEAARRLGNVLKSGKIVEIGTSEQKVG